MRDSGTVLEWDLDRPVLDKHSTGGVGDKVSLILAPILAACGAAVPMISGRGLGHTGGTLDKLDSIPGYRRVPATEVIRRVVREAGCAIVGQTADLAPADRRLYAVRDATGTVESIPLIVASILSKKLAEGLDALVLDVKTGSGAFMARREDAQQLAEALVEVAKGAGLNTVALITDMDEVLGTTAGNALEVRESIEHLTGAAREPRLHQVTLALAAAALVQARLHPTRRPRARPPRRRSTTAAPPSASRRWSPRWAGRPTCIESPGSHLPHASVTKPVAPERPGYVAGSTRAPSASSSPASAATAGARTTRSTTASGSAGSPAIGTEVGPDCPLAIVHARGDSSADEAATALRAAIQVAPEPPADRRVLLGRV